MRAGERGQTGPRRAHPRALPARSLKVGGDGCGRGGADAALQGTQAVAVASSLVAARQVAGGEGSLHRMEEEDALLERAPQVVVQVPAASQGEGRDCRHDPVGAHILGPSYTCGRRPYSSKLRSLGLGG